MSASIDVAGVRAELGITQVQLAQLLGVHPLTVSKWEREVLKPSPHAHSLLSTFRKAARANKRIGREVGILLARDGVPMALHALLRTAFF